MKSAKILAAVLLFISFSFSNCSPDHDFLSSTNEIITHGNWGVEYLANPDKTSEYGNYTLQFQGSGKLSLSNSNISIEGTWKVIHDVDRTDLLTIHIDQSGMTDLNSTWSVKSKSINALELISKEQATEFRIHKLN